MTLERTETINFQLDETELQLWPKGFSYGYNITGSGVIDQAHFWRTHRADSKAHAGRLFNPEPNSGRFYYTGDMCPANQECDLWHRAMRGI